MRAVLTAFAILSMAFPALARASTLCRITTAEETERGRTCTAVTQNLLSNLKYATKHQVISAFSGSGATLEDGLHYKSFAAQNGAYSGVVNFVFKDGRVAEITALLVPYTNTENNGQKLMFVWSEDPLNQNCSDFPGSIGRCTVTG